MAKKVVVVCGSPRIGGNSEVLADSFIKGAKEAGHKVNKIRLAEKQVLPCRGCNHCYRNNATCAIDDDMNSFYPDVLAADVIVFVSPVYYYGFSAQLKAFIDRLYGPDVKGDIAEAMQGNLPQKECALFMTAADEKKSVFDLAVMHFRKIFEHWFMWSNRGIILAGGVSEVGDIKGHPKLEEAYEMGKSL